jgi:hypothetical protein
LLFFGGIFQYGTFQIWASLVRIRFGIRALV